MPGKSLNVWKSTLEWTIILAAEMNRFSVAKTADHRKRVMTANFDIISFDVDTMNPTAKGVPEF